MRRLIEALHTSGAIRHPVRALVATLRDGKRQAGAFAILTLACVLAATVWLWREATQESARLAQARFAFKVKEAEFAMQQRLKAYEQVLRGGVGLFAADGDVHRDAWRAYVGTLEIGKNYPGIQGIGFSLRVSLRP